MTTSKASSSSFAPWQLSGDTRLNVLTVFGIFSGALLFLQTRRVELLATVALPVALRLIASFRTSALVTSCVMLVWFSRIPTAFFDFAVFSYAVYASVAITIAAFLLRMTHGGAPRLPLITNRWLWLFVAVVLAGGANGLRNVEAIPAWMLTGSNPDYGIPWVYFRTILLPCIFLPLLAMVTAAAIADRQKPGTVMFPAWVFAAVMSLMVLVQVALSGQALGAMSDATNRIEHLTALGFHSNEIGTLLAISYALILGARSGMAGAIGKGLTLLVLCAVGAALVLTFSRGALLAFLVVNAFFFVTGSRQRAIFAVVIVAGWLAAPAAVLERARFGFDSGNLNEISAGRLDNIWLPLLPDIADHLLVGQGLHSILWTDAQRLQQIYPVAVAHNGYLDLVLDVGVLGAIAVLGWYVYLWFGFRRAAASDPDPVFRGLFRGGQMAVLALCLCALSNDRLTPTSPACLLWVVSGVLLGRQVQLRRDVVPAPARRRAFISPWRQIESTRPLITPRQREA